MWVYPAVDILSENKPGTPCNRPATWTVRTVMSLWAPSLFPGFLLALCWKDIKWFYGGGEGFGEDDWRTACWEVVKIRLRVSVSPNP